MPNQFVEVQFPPNISYGSKGGPGFNTDVFEADSGEEQRNQKWSQARCRYDVSQGIRSKDDMMLVLDFFYNMKGRAVGFRFKDWSDYHLPRTNIGTGNGVLVAFQLVRKYTVGALTHTRTLKKIVTGTVQIWVNDILIDPADYTVDDDTGIVTFDVAPGNTLAVEAACEFDVPVRFDTDLAELSLEAFEQESWDSIMLVEVKPQS